MNVPALRCSFCGKPASEVRKLIAGQSALICDLCVDLCIAIVSGTGIPETRAQRMRCLELACERYAREAVSSREIVDAAEAFSRFVHERDPSPDVAAIDTKGFGGTGTASDPLVPRRDHGSGS